MIWHYRPNSFNALKATFVSTTSFIEDEDTITLRRITQPANHGLVDLLLACPSTFEVPARDADDREPPSL